jgi:hypothetical protein
MASMQRHCNWPSYTIDNSAKPGHQAALDRYLQGNDCAAVTAKIMLAVSSSAATDFNSSIL